MAPKPESIPDLANDAPELAHALRLILKRAPGAFAVTSGRKHTVVFANAAFSLLTAKPQYVLGQSIATVLGLKAKTRLTSLLDQAITGPESMRDRFLGALSVGTDTWNCTIWPVCHVDDRCGGLVVELHKATHPARRTAIQREVAERLLLTALREAEAADEAAAAHGRSALLADATRRFNESLDETATRLKLAGMSLPDVVAWCIVDIIEPDTSISRLAIVHPDPDKQELLHALQLSWTPHPGDPFGAPAVMLDTQPIMIADNLDEALKAGSHSTENLRVLRELGVGALLTVPLISHGQLLGALTFVSKVTGRPYTREEIELAQGLAAHSADALDNARRYGEALLLRELAETESQNRMRFLRTVSHEFRTPLNAIIGYVDLITEGIHGPVTQAQRSDLDRIRLNQEHLQILITDFLNYVRTDGASVQYAVDVPISEVVTEAFSLLESLFVKKSIRYRRGREDSRIIALADPDRVQQILLNLIGNAIKFTPIGGQIVTSYDATEDQVRITVADNGPGIPPDKLDAIFEPFVQVGDAPEWERGSGLGLTVSRDLAHAMGGDLLVTSTVGAGSCFTLTLPRAQATRESAT
ncbi:MAG: HAMP domain-containing sensor histidine kinase [Gemmatimonadota bacterium]